MATKRIHLANENGGRSRCRYTSRPSIRALFVSQEQFEATPEAQRCQDCQAKLTKLQGGEPNKLSKGTGMAKKLMMAFGWFSSEETPPTNHANAR